MARWKIISSSSSNRQPASRQRRRLHEQRPLPSSRVSRDNNRPPQSLQARGSSSSTVGWKPVGDNWWGTTGGGKLGGTFPI